MPVPTGASPTGVTALARDQQKNQPSGHAPGQRSGLRAPSPALHRALIPPYRRGRERESLMPQDAGLPRPGTRARAEERRETPAIVSAPSRPPLNKRSTPIFPSFCSLRLQEHHGCPRPKGRGDKRLAVLEPVCRRLASGGGRGWPWVGAVGEDKQLKVPLCVALTDVSGRGQLGVSPHLPKSTCTEKPAQILWLKINLHSPSY